MATTTEGAKCDGWCNRKGRVAMIGEKGYVYCEPCGRKRSASGYERVRLLSRGALDALHEGRVLRSYEDPTPLPKAASDEFHKVMDSLPWKPYP